MKGNTKIKTNTLVEFFTQMTRIRFFEEECSRQYTQGNITGFLHLYIGEEAIAVGAISALQTNDYVISHYRDHGHALAKGIESNVIMAELFGKATGCSKGKGGSMHLFDAEKRFMGGHAIVGGQLPISIGLALASKYKNEDSVVLCFLGDGAMQEGEFHETMNLASIWKLPVIFCCENNLYGMGAAVSDTFALHDELYKIADAYRMPGVVVDGMDVSKVNATITKAVEAVRGGKGPIFIEAKTYRFRGHSISDPANYREKKELEEWSKKDPIDALKTVLVNEGIMSGEDISKIEANIEAEVAESVRFAEESPWPDPSALYEDVDMNSQSSNVE